MAQFLQPSHINELVKRNDILIAKLKKVCGTNNEERHCYKTFLNQKTLQSQPPIKKGDHLEATLEKQFFKAAIIIQRAYRLHLLLVKSRLRAQNWMYISSKKNVEYIKVISERAAQPFAVSKFVMMHQKQNLVTFEGNRSERAAIFEKRKRFIVACNNERAFITSKDFSTCKNEQFAPLKPYLYAKASIELLCQIDAAKLQSIIRHF